MRLRTGALVLSMLFVAAHGAAADERIDLRLDTAEAEAVLAALETKDAGEIGRNRAFHRIFTSEAYVRLKRREASLHRDFTDGEFEAFVLSPGLTERAPALRRTLEAWKKEDLAAAGRRVLPYLPEQAVIRAKVYIVIKPKTNSFVFELATDPAIFLYLDPEKTAAQFANTVAHELHHIGFSSVKRDAAEANAPFGVRKALEWMGAFGEGFAMLAAAGSPDVHPHATSPVADRERWDRDMAHVDDDLKTLEKFFLDVLDGRLKTEAEIDEKGYSFFGVQGPWYTVGYRMAVVIEKRDGRKALVACMADPRRLLAAYDRAAAEINATAQRPLALWSGELLKKIGAQ
jgi:hypothetical protein